MALSHSLVRGLAPQQARVSPASTCVRQNPSCLRTHRIPQHSVILDGRRVRMRNQLAEPVTEFSNQDELELAYPPFTTKVEDVMTDAEAVTTTTPSATIRNIVGLLDDISGLPVLEHGVIVGVITRKDILKAQALQNFLDLPVEKLMSKPAVTIRKEAHLSEAAELILLHRIHRLPVLEQDGSLAGIVSRTNIFKPALSFKKSMYKMASLDEQDEGHVEWVGSAQLLRVGEKAVETAGDSWSIKYLYDGECQMCKTLKATLERKDTEGRIKFVNIASKEYNPEDNADIEYEEAMETIHAIYKDGTIKKGPEALTALYKACGLGWVATLAELPFIAPLFGMFYAVLSHFRIPLGKGMDSFLAMRSLQLSQEGVEHCTQTEEECEAPDW